MESCALEIAFKSLEKHESVILTRHITGDTFREICLCAQKSQHINTRVSYTNPRVRISTGKGEIMPLKRTLVLVSLIFICLALLLMFLVLLASWPQAIAAETDPLDYSFEESDEEEVVEMGQDYVLYQFQARTEYRFQVTVLVENTGEETVNFTHHAFDREDLDPNPNTGEEEKIELNSYGGSYNLDGERSRTLKVSIELSEGLISYENPYILALNFRNDDTKTSHTMHVKMNILPVYELVLSDADGDMERTIRAGHELTLTQILRNQGNRNDDVQMVVDVEGEWITATITKPDDGQFEDMISELQDARGSETIIVKLATDEVMDSGEYLVTVTAKSMNDPDTEAAVQYTITVKDTPDPPEDPNLPQEEEEDGVPWWLWFGMVGLLAGGGGGSSLIWWSHTKEEDEEEEDEWNQGDWEEDGHDDDTLLDDVDTEHDDTGRGGDAPFDELPTVKTRMRTPPTPTAVRLTCPRCLTPFRLSSRKRPLNVKCPGCFSQITLKGKKSEGSQPPRPQTPRQESKPSPTTGQVRVSCPRCHTGFRVRNPKRPLKVRCPGCRSPITLKGKPAAGREHKAQGSGDTTRLTCPACQVRFRVNNPKRPLKARCPGCSRVLTLK